MQMEWDLCSKYNVLGFFFLFLSSGYVVILGDQKYMDRFYVC